MARDREVLVNHCLGINSENFSWNVVFVRVLGWKIEVFFFFLNVVYELFYSMRASVEEEDKARWKINSTVIFSVESYYGVLLKQSCKEGRKDFPWSDGMQLGKRFELLTVYRKKEMSQLMCVFCAK